MHTYTHIHNIHTLTHTHTRTTTCKTTTLQAVPHLQNGVMKSKLHFASSRADVTVSLRPSDVPTSYSTCGLDPAWTLFVIGTLILLWRWLYAPAFAHFLPPIWGRALHGGIFPPYLKMYQSDPTCIFKRTGKKSLREETALQPTPFTI